MMDLIARNRETTVKLSDRQVFALKYADDVVLPAESVTEIQESLSRFANFSKEASLPINLIKTVVMVFKRSN